MSNVSYDVKFITSSSGRLSGSTTAGAGTITIDFDTLENDSVTIRDRDTTKQDRVAISKIESYLANMLK